MMDFLRNSYKGKLTDSPFILLLTYNKKNNNLNINRKFCNSVDKSKYQYFNFLFQKLSEHKRNYILIYAIVKISII